MVNNINTQLAMKEELEDKNPTMHDAISDIKEFAKAAFAEIKTGRMVLESESKVEHIHLTKTGNDFVDITVAKASNVEMPDFSRDPVDLSAGSKVVALQDGTAQEEEKEYVWIMAMALGKLLRLKNKIIIQILKKPETRVFLWQR